MKKFKKYIKETWKNKAVALLLLILGVISAIINNDSTAFVFILLLFVVPLCLEKRNRIE